MFYLLSFILSFFCLLIFFLSLENESEGESDQLKILESCIFYSKRAPGLAETEVEIPKTEKRPTYGDLTTPAGIKK